MSKYDGIVLDTPSQGSHYDTKTTVLDSGGPAFPFLTWQSPVGFHIGSHHGGMTLRDYVAARALPALLTELYQSCRERREKIENIYRAASMAAFECADAFIEARSLSKEGGEE